MAGNSRRPGATRKSARKGSTAGSGGKNRRRLEGRGPTPRAEDRPYHPAAKRKAEAERRASGSQQRRRDERPSLLTGGHEVIVGRNPVLEALRAGVPATRLEIALAGSSESEPRLREILTLAAEAGLRLAEYQPLELERRAGPHHQGVALVVPPYDYSRVEDLLARADDAGHAPLIVALDSVTDPHNLGAAGRSAAAFGADGVLIPERRSAPMGATAWKVSAGAAARVPVAHATNLVRDLVKCQNAGCFVVGLDMGGEADIQDVDLLTEPCVIVTGSEGKGLSRLVRDTCDTVAAIPMLAGTESLNASVATGIALYAAYRVRHQE